jgi:Protein of unknown function (DUF1580)
MATASQQAKDGNRFESAGRVRREGPIPLDVAAESIRSYASPASLLRWIINGASGVRLDGTRIGGKWHTSLAAIGRFMQARYGNRSPGM